VYLVKDIHHSNQLYVLLKELSFYLLIGKIKSFIKIKNSWQIWIQIKSKFKKFLITKGSVSVNGISLTINNIKNNMFRVDIIPHTFNKTNLNKLKKNSTVNIEYDLLIKFLKQNVK